LNNHNNLLKIAMMNSSLPGTGVIRWMYGLRSVTDTQIMAVI